ncbi:hypothetical protein P154DRAFT_258454 [Amniculicola lignicola CBS 123094]|uniref:Uncharacterized protein n=1 Tax=Amniculicola lignicola CBS 123094 TaxID=1392246 RepID=A0A6A5WZF0_9PLEO|nr:hypothetical protein P154DRAFT_258454 [Amniculicola lignicola CBS 123094]
MCNQSNRSAFFINEEKQVPNAFSTRRPRHLVWCCLLIPYSYIEVFFFLFYYLDGVSVGVAMIHIAVEVNTGIRTGSLFTCLIIGDDLRPSARPSCQHGLHIGAKSNIGPFSRLFCPGGSDGGFGPLPRLVTKTAS